MTLHAQNVTVGLICDNLGNVLSIIISAYLESIGSYCTKKSSMNIYPHSIHSSIAKSSF